MRLTQKLAFIGVLISLLIIGNPANHPKLIPLPKTKSTARNYGVFSIAASSPSYFKKSVQYHLGIVGFWVPLKLDVLSCNSLCRNGICFLGECICFSGWKGKGCSVKHSDFVSLWRGGMRPFALKIMSAFNDHLAMDWKNALWFYFRSDCILGIPIDFLDSRIVEWGSFVGLENLSERLTLIDVYLATLIILFIYCKMIQAGLYSRTSLFDLSWYNIEQRENYISLLIAPFWNPHTLPFLYNIYSFYHMAPWAQGILGFQLFHLYFWALVVITNVSSIYIASISGKRMTIFHGMTNIVTGIKFLEFWFAWDRKSVFTTSIFPHHFSFFLTGGSSLDTGGIVSSIFLSYLFYWLRG